MLKSYQMMLKQKIVKKLVITTGIVLFASVLYLSIYSYLSRPKIAYVRSLEIVYSYNGMRQAHAEYQSQTNEWQSNIDTLRKQYEQAVAEYNKNAATLSDKDKKQKEEELKRLEANYKNYAATVSREAQDKDKKLTQAILNQINSFIESYAKNKGYDIVLGTQGNSSVLYGTKSMDITNEVIEAMNKEYKLLPVANSK